MLLVYPVEHKYVYGNVYLFYEAKSCNYSSLIHKTNPKSRQDLEQYSYKTRVFYFFAPFLGSCLVPCLQLE